MPHADPEKRRSYQREYQKRNREELQAYGNEWRRRRYAEDPEYRAGSREATRSIPAHVTAARARVYQAIKRGEIARPTHCPECGRETFVEAAHENYKERLAIRWLCRSCHRKWDKEQPKEGRPVRPNPRISVSWRTRPTHCKHGHEFTPENTYTRKDGSRSCMTCQRESLRR